VIYGRTGSLPQWRAKEARTKVVDSITKSDKTKYSA
jgi:hypothetical protein